MKIVALPTLAALALGGCSSQPTPNNEPQFGEVSKNPWVHGEYEWRPGYYDRRGDYVKGHYVRVDR